MVRVLVILALLVGLLNCSNDATHVKNEPTVQPVITLSISSDGRYVIGTRSDGSLLLWDIKNKTEEKVADNANIYSPYFIKHTNKFMWQDAESNEVYVKNVSGENVLQIHTDIPTYGEVMTTDLKHYYGSDVNWDLYHYSNFKFQKIEKGFHSFLGTGKLLNMMLSGDDKYLVTAGFGNSKYSTIPLKADQGRRNLNDVVLWDVDQGKPIYKLLGNIAKTNAVISPDGQRVVTGDEDTWGYVWDTHTGHPITELWGIWLGHPMGKDENGVNINFDKTGLLSVPKDFHQDGGFKSSAILAMRFIDTHGHFLRFTTYIPYAILYQKDDPKPVKYLPLGKHPYPAVHDYGRSQAIDTAPDVGVLVMAQASKAGINVYQYNPTNQSLNKTWVSG